MHLFTNNAFFAWTVPRQSFIKKPLRSFQSFLIATCILFSPFIYAKGCNNKTAIISAGSTYPPLSWRNNGKLTGASIELIKNIFAELGIEALPDAGGPWKRVVLRAQKGQLDMLVGVRRNKDREKFLTFIDPPISPAAQSIFIRKDDTDNYDDWSKLKKKVGSTTLGVSFGPEFDAFSKEHLYIEQVRSTEQNFKKLLKKRVDYILGPLLPTLLYIEKNGYRYKIKSVRKPLLIIDEFVAFSNNSDCKQHIEYFKKRINEYINNGEMDTLMEKHYLLWQADISENKS